MNMQAYVFRISGTEINLDIKHLIVYLAGGM